MNYFYRESYKNRIKVKKIMNKYINLLNNFKFHIIFPNLFTLKI